MLNLDKTKQREIRNAVIVGISASASTSIWDSIKLRFPESELLQGENTELVKAAAGAGLLALAPKKSGLAKDLVENIGLGMVASGVLNFAAPTVGGFVSGLLAPKEKSLVNTAGYRPRIQSPALGNTHYGTQTFSADIAPVI